MSQRRRSVSDERRKIKLDSKFIKFKFFEKQKNVSEITMTKTLHEHRGINFQSSLHINNFDVAK